MSIPDKIPVFLPETKDKNMLLDPDTQQELRSLLRAESRRVKQQNFSWRAGWWAVGIFLGGYALMFLFIISAGSCHSAAYNSASNNVASNGMTREDFGNIMRTLAEGKAAIKEAWKNPANTHLSNGTVYNGEYILYPNGNWELARYASLDPKIKEEIRQADKLRGH